MKLDYNLAWRFLNEEAFWGEMIPPKIHCFKGSIWGPNREVLVGTYHCNSSEILLHTGTYVEDHLGGPLEALYHEMVHQYIEEVLDASYEYTDHGRLFWSVYREGLEKLYDKGNMVMAKTKKKGKKPAPFGKGQAGHAPPGVKAKGYKK